MVKATVILSQPLLAQWPDIEICRSFLITVTFLLLRPSTPFDVQTPALRLISHPHDLNPSFMAQIPSLKL